MSRILQNEKYCWVELPLLLLSELWKWPRAEPRSQGRSDELPCRGQLLHPLVQMHIVHLSHLYFLLSLQMYKLRTKSNVFIDLPSGWASLVISMHFLCELLWCLLKLQRKDWTHLPTKFSPSQEEKILSGKRSAESSWLNYFSNDIEKDLYRP